MEDEREALFGLDAWYAVTYQTQKYYLYSISLSELTTAARHPQNYPNTP